MTLKQILRMNRKLLDAIFLTGIQRWRFGRPLSLKGDRGVALRVPPLKIGKCASNDIENLQETSRVSNANANNSGSSIPLP